MRPLLVTVSTPYTYQMRKAYYQHRRVMMAQRRSAVCSERVFSSNHIDANSPGNSIEHYDSTGDSLGPT